MRICKENGVRIVRMEAKQVRTLEAAVEICRELGEENKHLPANAAAGSLGQLIEKFGPAKKAAANAGAAVAEQGDEGGDAQEE